MKLYYKNKDKKVDFFMYYNKLIMKQLIINRMIEKTSIKKYMIYGFTYFMIVFLEAFLYDIDTKNSMVTSCAFMATKCETVAKYCMDHLIEYSNSYSLFGKHLHIMNSTGPLYMNTMVKNYVMQLIRDTNQLDDKLKSLPAEMIAICGLENVFKKELKEKILDF